MVHLSYKGDWKATTKFLENALNVFDKTIFDKYGKMGVDALAAATPKDTGKTAASWTYKIRKSNSSVTLEWWNDNIVDGVPIALILQYGHSTGWGYYVQGRDYINPALKPVFDEISEKVFKEVTKN